MRPRQPRPREQSRPRGRHRQRRRPRQRRPPGNARGARPVGLALWYYTFSTFTGRPDIFLEDLFVEPQHRGAGIGRALLGRLAQQAMADRCRRIEWRVLNWNQPAIDFYTRIGAKPMQDWHVRQLDGNALAALAQGVSHA